MGDVPVADREQVLDEAARTGGAVADHEVAVGVRQNAVEQDERKAPAQQRKDAVAGRVTRGRQQQALDPVRHQILDIFALEAEVALAVAEQDAIAGAPSSCLGATHHGREERVDHVGNDEADRLSLLRQEPASDTVRHVVELGDHLLDSALRLGVDARPSVDDTGHRHCRNASTSPDFLQGNGHRASC